MKHVYKRKNNKNKWNALSKTKEIEEYIYIISMSFLLDTLIYSFPNMEGINHYFGLVNLELNQAWSDFAGILIFCYLMETKSNLKVEKMINKCNQEQAQCTWWGLGKCMLQCLGVDHTLSNTDRTSVKGTRYRSIWV